jgi:hypothetical protein
MKFNRFINLTLGNKEKTMAAEGTDSKTLSKHGLILFDF